MKFHRLLIALTVFNLGLLVFLLAQIEVRFLGFGFARTVAVNNAGSPADVNTCRTPAAASVSTMEGSPFQP